jgi:hypothetical protein
MAALAFAVSFGTSFGASTGQIVGTVIGQDTNKPVAGAQVTAASPSGTFHAVSDSRGTFTLVGVTLDTYTISVQAQGYQPFAAQGVTVTADEAVHLPVTLSKLRTIGVVRSRSITSAYQPDQTVDRYTVNAQGIAQLLGKNFNVDQKKLLAELPGVTVDKTGTPLIRGGFNFQTSFQVEGVDYTLPNRSLGNRFENAGNSNLLNGTGSAEIIPGGGDATHGDTGTGLIALTIKRGTYPAAGLLDLETEPVGGGHQVGVEYGLAGRHLSDYFSYVASNVLFQYGPYGTAASGIGASAITQDPNANSNVLAHFGALYTSAAFNTAAQQSRNFVNNFVARFGRDNRQSLQFFVQSQAVRQTLNYGGIEGLTVQNPADYLSTIGLYGGNAVNAMLGAERIVTPYPGYRPGQPLTVQDTIYSPFNVYKLEYGNLLNNKTSLGVRFYRTFALQSGQEPDQGLSIPQNGGTRTGASMDLTEAFSSKHTVQIGGKYEFAHPFGTVDDFIDYVPAYSGGTTFSANQINIAIPAYLAADFVVPQPYAIAGGVAHGTPGCANASPLPGQPALAGFYQCGYLSQFFPRGIPRLPLESEVPTANQQIYGWYAQDTWSPNTRLRALLGLRLDGYNFLLPNDPQFPAAIDGIRHQRLFEPHVGLAYQLTRRDALRINYGRTLSIPLPTFIGVNLDQSLYSAFAGVPSYDNSKGPFDPLRPGATRATYCGPGKVTPGPNGSVSIIGNQPCANYADQLYWLERDYRFGLQNTFGYPLRGATFTNYDLSYSHEFKNGTAVKLTPFYRRGYDVVETTRTLLGWDPQTEVPSLSPPIYANLGIQRATGVELYITHPAALGFSYQFSATYINQIGNDPPGAFLPTASLQLGELYRSPNLSPFQTTLGLTYRLANGLRINPVFSYRYGYPYGAGVYQAIDYNGQPVYIPITDAIVNGINAGWISQCFVNPQAPGSIFNPNLAACRGAEAAAAGAGTLRTPSTLNTDITIELAKPGTGMTYGIAVTNLFDQVADIPQFNVARPLQAVGTGHFYCLPGNTANRAPGYGPPLSVGSSCSPYIIFPNQLPLALRAYVQVRL